jgi:Fe-S cluster biogenesis protein NfuA
VGERTAHQWEINPQEIGETIGRKLDELQARADPRVHDQALALLQLITDLYGAGLARIMELAERHAPQFVDQITSDELVASLLIANALHPDDIHVRITRALDRVRPFLAGHGGDVELLEIDEPLGAVRLRLLGSCDGCPSSAITLRTTVERAILESAPEVVLIDVEQPSEDTVATPGLTASPFDTPIALGTKPAIIFDPATGCGAALEPNPSAR